MSVAEDQAQRFTPSFWGPLKGLHDWVNPLQRNQGAIYTGGGSRAISNQGSRWNFFEISRSAEYFCGVVVELLDLESIFQSF